MTYKRNKTPRKWVAVFLAIIMAGSLNCTSYITAQAAEKATGIKMTLDRTEGSNIKIADKTGEALTIRDGMTLYNGYVITTGADSYVYIMLDNEKAIQLDRNTEVEIQKKKGRNEINVLSGSVLFHVAKKLSPEETMNVRTSNIAMGIRGTVGVVIVGDELDEEGNEKTVHKAMLLDGEADVTVTDGDGNTGGTGLQAGEIVTNDGESPISDEMIDNLTGDDIPSFALNTVASDPDLGSKVGDALGLSQEELEALARRKAEAERLQGQNDGTGEAGQDNQIIPLADDNSVQTGNSEARTPAGENEGDAGDSGTDSSSGGGSGSDSTSTSTSPSAGPYTVVPEESAEFENINTWFTKSAHVIVDAKNIEGAELRSLSLSAGQTLEIITTASGGSFRLFLNNLYVAPGAVLSIGAGVSLDIYWDGSADIHGTLNNEGYISGDLTIHQYDNGQITGNEPSSSGINVLAKKSVTLTSGDIGNQVGKAFERRGPDSAKTVIIQTGGKVTMDNPSIPKGRELIINSGEVEATSTTIEGVFEVNSGVIFNVGSLYIWNSLINRGTIIVTDLMIGVAGHVTNNGTFQVNDKSGITGDNWSGNPPLIPDSGYMLGEPIVVEEPPEDEEPTDDEEPIEGDETVSGNDLPEASGEEEPQNETE